MLLLLVDDEPAVLRSLRRLLRRAGHTVDSCDSAEAALELVKQKEYAVLVVDWLLPETDGVSLCRQLTRRGVVSGLFILTGRPHDADDRLAARAAGAHEFAVKGDDPRELVARIEVLGRLIASAQATRARSGSIRLDERGMRVCVGSLSTELTRCELMLLRALLRSPGELLSHAALLEVLCGDARRARNSVAVHVRNLRAKLGSAGARLVSARSRGYRLAP